MSRKTSILTHAEGRFLGRCGGRHQRKTLRCPMFSSVFVKVDSFAPHLPQIHRPAWVRMDALLEDANRNASGWAACQFRRTCHPPAYRHYHQHKQTQDGNLSTSRYRVRGRQVGFKKWFLARVLDQKIAYRARFGVSRWILCVDVAQKRTPRRAKCRGWGIATKPSFRGGKTREGSKVYNLTVHKLTC